MFIPFYGKHMLNNALACISCCYLLNMNILDIINSLKTYKNATRRYNITYINDNVIVDDYGHHPDEINAVLKETLDFSISSDYNKSATYTRDVNNISYVIGNDIIYFISDIFIPC